MILNHFLASWGDYANPRNEYMVEELSASGMLTVQVRTAASREEVYEQYKSSHYVAAADNIVTMPKLKLMQKY